MTTTPVEFRGLAASAEVLAATPDTAPDPLALATSWLDVGPDRPPLETVLATVDEHGWPSARTVLLSRFDGEAFHVNTMSSSAKAADLRARPRAALLVRLADQGRQLSVQADVHVQDPEVAAEIYRDRSEYLRRLAWVNEPDYALLGDAEREHRWSLFDLDADGAAPPAGWAGFVLRPRRLTFWAASSTMASRRLDYRLGDAGWTCTVLPG